MCTLKKYINGIPLLYLHGARPLVLLRTTCKQTGLSINKAVSGFPGLYKNTNLQSLDVLVLHTVQWTLNSLYVPIKQDVF